MSQLSETDKNITDDIFYNFLNSEIEYLRGELERPGWTHWTLIGGLAYLVWLLLNLLENYQPNIISISFLITIFFSIHLLYYQLDYLFGDNSSRQQKNKFELAKNLLGNNRIYIGCLLLISVSIFFLSFYLPINIGYYTLIYIRIFFSFYIIVLLVALIISFIKIPISLNSSKTLTGYIGYTIITFLLIYILYSLSLYILYDITNINIYDIRFSGLILGIVYLFLILIKVPRHSLILLSLIDIRRNYVLDDLSKNEAIRQTSIILTGLEASKYLHPSVEKYLDLLNKINSKLDNLKKKSEILKKIDNRTSKKLSDDDKEIVKSIKDSSGNIIQDIYILVDGLGEVLNSLKFRIQYFSKFSVEKIEIDDLLNQMTEASVVINEKIILTHKELENCFEEMDSNL